MRGLQVKLPALVTVYAGRHVYRETAPEELVSPDAIKDGLSRLKVQAKRVEGDKEETAAVKLHIKEFEAALPKTKEPAGKGNKTGGEK